MQLKVHSALLEGASENPKHLKITNPVVTKTVIQTTGIWTHPAEKFERVCNMHKSTSFTKRTDNYLTGLPKSQHIKATILSDGILLTIKHQLCVSAICKIRQFFGNSN